MSRCLSLLIRIGSWHALSDWFCCPLVWGEKPTNLQHGPPQIISEEKGNQGENENWVFARELGLVNSGHRSLPLSMIPDFLLNAFVPLYIIIWGYNTPSPMIKQCVPNCAAAGVHGGRTDRNYRQGPDKALSRRHLIRMSKWRDDVSLKIDSEDYIYLPLQINGLEFLGCRASSQFEWINLNTYC